MKLTTPDFTTNVEPGGRAGYPGIGVMLTFGTLEAPPVYLNCGVVQTGGFAETEQVAVEVVHAIWRNTKTDLATPAAPLAASSTRTTNEYVPAEVGLPVILPSDDKANPLGRAPELIVHLYGLTPPAAPSTTVAYASPTSPMWNGTLVMINLAGLGEAAGGDASGVGDSAGVGAVLGVGEVASDGLASGELVGWPICWVQAAMIRTSPASTACAKRLLSIP